MGIIFRFSKPLCGQDFNFWPKWLCLCLWFSAGSTILANPPHTNCRQTGYMFQIFKSQNKAMYPLFPIRYQWTQEIRGLLRNLPSTGWHQTDLQTGTKFRHWQRSDTGGPLHLRPWTRSRENRRHQQPRCASESRLHEYGAKRGWWFPSRMAREGTEEWETSFHTERRMGATPQIVEMATPVLQELRWHRIWRR